MSLLILRSKMNYLRLALVVCLLVVIPYIAIGVGSAEEQDEFGAYVPDPYLEPGTEQNIDIDLQYQGETTENLTESPVNNVSAELTVDGADSDFLEIRTEQQFVTDSMDENDTVSVIFSVIADDSLRFAEESDLETTLHIYYNDGANEQVDVTLQAQEQAYFAAQEPDDLIKVGETEHISFDLINEGYETAADTVIEITPAVSGVSVEPPTEQSVGEMPVGDQEQIDVALTVTDETLTGEVPLRITAEFRDENGIIQQSRELLVPVEIVDDQRFTTTIDKSTLRYGETGDVVLDITNTGESITDVTVGVESSSTDVSIVGGQDTEQISQWDSGETQTVRVAASVEETTQIDRAPLELTINYREDSSDRTAREGLVGAEVHTEQRFTGGIDREEPVYIGESHTIGLEFDNVRYGNVSDATVQFESLTGEVTIPDGTSDVEIAEWNEGSTQTANLTIEVSETATVDVVPLQAVVSYRTSEGVARESAPITLTLTIADDQQFQPSVLNSTLRYGETGDVTFEMTNTDVNITDATVQIQSLSSHVSVVDGQSQTYIGDWPQSGTEAITVSAVSDDDSPVETVPFEIIVDYRENGVDQESRSVVTGVSVSEERRFGNELKTDSLLRAGETRTVTIELENHRYGDVSNAVVVPQIPDEDAEIAGELTHRYVGTWEEGTSQIVNITVTVDEDAPADTLPIQSVVRYETTNELTRESASITGGVDVVRQQKVSIETTETEIFVGEDGIIEGTITNEGDEPVNDLLIRPEQTEVEQLPVAGDGSNIDIREDNYYIGSLEPNETTEFELTLSVSGQAEPGPRVIALQTEYENIENDRYTTSPSYLNFNVASERDAFAIELTEASVPVDGTAPLRFELTNKLNEPVTDVQAQLFSNDPLESDDDQAFVSQIEPNETVTMEFTIGADASAAEKAYPAEVDFQYTDANGDTQLSNVYTIPVDVTAEERNWLQIAVIIAILTVGAATLVFRYRESIPSIKEIR